MMNNKKSLLYYCNKIIFIVAPLIVFFIASISYVDQLPLLKGSQSFVLSIRPGMNLVQLHLLLTQSNKIKSPDFFSFMVRITDSDQKLQIGDYTIGKSTSYKSLRNAMVAGQGQGYRITVVEGWSFNDLRKAVAHHRQLLHTLDKLSNQEIMQRVSNGATAVYEGKFYPSTYSFTSKSSDLDLYRQAYRRYLQVMTKVGQDCDKGLPYNRLYDVVIVASIIQKESAYVPEYNKIAAVVVNRLRLGMRLQIDATLLYSPYEEDGHDYEDRQSLQSKLDYNTYRIHGLPPTAIAFPSIDAIMAACHPADIKSLYYVANGRGGHTFTKEFLDHIKEKLKYKKMRLKYKRDKIGSKPNVNFN